MEEDKNNIKEQEDMLDIAESSFYRAMSAIKKAKKHPKISKGGVFRAFLMAVNSGVTNYSVPFKNNYEKELAIQMKNMLDSSIPLKAFILEQTLQEQKELEEQTQKEKSNE